MSQEGIVLLFIEQGRFQMCANCIAADVYLISLPCLQDLSTGWLCCDPGPMFMPESYDLLVWTPQWGSKQFEPKSVTSIDNS
jgi:hypothetical protein